MNTLLMNKDIPVMEITKEGNCIVHEYELLPINIRKKDVNIEDYYAEWLTNRAIQMSRTNAKAILNSLRLSQSNMIAVCKSCHAVNLNDTYWMKEENENLSWKEVSLYRNEISKSLAFTALSGEVLRENGKIHTPELTTQGVSAKSWWREGDSLYLYKVGRKEVAASQILDCLQIDHVHYEAVTGVELENVTSEERRGRLQKERECIVKCKILSTEERAMVSFEEFAVYCEYHELNPYHEILKMDKRHYLEMQVADYILNNEDRHIGNWGLFMETGTGRLQGLYPLLDHDHAFSLQENILSQTVDDDRTLLEAAVAAQKELKLDLNQIKRPEYLTDTEWLQLQERKEQLIKSY